MAPNFRKYIFILGALLISACDQQLQVAEITQDSDPAQAADTYGEHLGVVNFPVSCNDRAQVLMTRGVGLLHHMTYMAAEKFFNDALQADPNCVLAYWGVAMTYIHPLWADLTSETQLARAVELIATAKPETRPYQQNTCIQKITWPMPTCRPAMRMQCAKL